MNPDSLIFLALAVGWAVYLVPMALKRNEEEAATSTTVDKFSHAMRVLNPRAAVEVEAKVAPSPGQAESVADPDAADLTGTPSVTSPAAKPVLTQADRAKLTAQRKAAAQAAARRRRVLTVLLLSDVLAAALYFAGIVGIASVIAPTLLTLTFLVLARVMVTREQSEVAQLRTAITQRRAASAQARAEREAALNLGVITEPAATRSEPLATNDQGLAVVSEVEETVAVDLAAVHAEINRRRAETAADEASLWDPLPMTLPTYLAKPKAGRSVATIALSDPGVTSAGHSTVDSQFVAEAASQQDGETPRQRAVGQ